MVVVGMAVAGAAAAGAAVAGAAVVGAGAALPSASASAWVSPAQQHGARVGAGVLQWHHGTAVPDGVGYGPGGAGGSSR